MQVKNDTKVIKLLLKDANKGDTLILKLRDRKCLYNHFRI